MKKKRRKAAPSASKVVLGPSADRIDEALNLAVRDAVRQHQQAGLPLAVWQDGQTVWIPASQVKSPNGRKRRKKS